MKVQFTILQVALTTVLVFLLCACIGGDILIFILDFGDMNKSTFLFNAIICGVVLIVSLIFVCKPSLTGFVKKADREACDPIPALSAIRTYICFIALDAAIVLSLMIFGKLILDDAIKYILIVCPSIFILGAVKYIADVRKIGVNVSDDGEDYDDYEW